MQASDPPGGAPVAGPDGPRPAHPGAVIRLAGDYAWRLLAIGAVGFFAVRLLSKLSTAVVPFVVAILLTALLHPLAVRLRRIGLKRGLSTVVAMMMAVIALGGVITVVVLRAAQEAPQLGNEINNLLPQVKHWLIHGPLKVNATTVNNLETTISNAVTKNSSAIASTALATGKTVLTFLEGLLLAAFSTVFLVYDGDNVWRWLLRGVPADARPAVDAAGRAAWTTISYYIRGTLIVAVFHGTVIALTLTLLGVPLAFPLAVLVALGSFIPLIGAIVTGILAVGVAGLSQGLAAAVIMVAVLLLDNQIEAHVLQPFVVGRYVRIHPLAVVMSLAAAGLLFGIVGAALAVPVVASINSAVRAARAVHANSATAPPPEKVATGPSPDDATGPPADHPPHAPAGPDPGPALAPAPPPTNGEVKGGPLAGVFDPPRDGP
jgi:predicted PurR-regulated permease PerM